MPTDRMTADALEFFVPGVPAPGGSKKGFVNPRTKRVVIVDDAGQKNKDWRNSVKFAARDAIHEAFSGPVSLDVTFYMPRPKAHYRANGELKPSAPRFHTTKPDRTKLLRSTEDALSDAGVWRDDTQVVDGPVRKVYADDVSKTGARIVIKALSGGIVS